MSGFSILMFIFAGLTILAGLYIYTGHNSELLLWKGYNKNATKEDLQKTGKWTMIVGLFIMVLGIIGIFFE